MKKMYVELYNKKFSEFKKIKQDKHFLILEI